jgi:hypothetical protein
MVTMRSLAIHSLSIVSMGGKPFAPLCTCATCVCVLYRSAEFIIAFNRGIDAAANLLEAGLVAGVVQAKVRQQKLVALGRVALGRRWEGGGGGESARSGDRRAGSVSSNRQRSCCHKVAGAARVLQASHGWVRSGALQLVKKAARPHCRGFAAPAADHL